MTYPRRNKKSIRKKLKQTSVSAYLVWYRFKILEGSPEVTRKTTEERICERDNGIGHFKYKMPKLGILYF